MQDNDKKLKLGFMKTKKTLSDRIKGIFTGNIDEELYEELTEILVLADVPFAAAEKIIEGARAYLKRGELDDYAALQAAVRKSALAILLANQSEPFSGIEEKTVLLVSGVNGVGKTTSIAKLANIVKKSGKSVLLAAADTFRAAASEQLGIWAQRLDVPIVRSAEGQDASGVIFDALASAAAKNIDVVICDTAGRLQSKKNLMNELEKMYRVADKNRGDYSMRSLIVLDAMSGQNSIAQLESFSEIRQPDGIMLTKIDGSAKGGVLLGIASQSSVPVWYIGTGEGVEDIALFDPQSYVDAMFEE